MNTRKNEKLVAMIALGLVGAAAGVANAQTGVIKSPKVINISGATLQENAFSVPASTNDYIGINGGGNVSLTPSQAADNNTNFWNVQYRGVGSINGLIELGAYGSSFVTALDNGTPGLPLTWFDISSARFNRKQYAANSAPLLGGSDIANIGNPGAAPVRSDDRLFLDEANTVANPDFLKTVYAAKPSPATFVYDPTPAGGATVNVGGIRIDIAAADVPLAWAVVGPNTAAASPTKTPTQPGYGRNPAVSKNKQGGNSGAGLSSLLGDLSLSGANVASVTPSGSWNSKTIFEYQSVYVPIAAIVNYGVGMTQIDATDLQHLFTTGRRNTGENLMAVTRDFGSGTRTGFMSSLGIDASWGNGENVGPLNGGNSVAAGFNNRMGEDFYPSNKNGSGALEQTVFNSRLGVGTTGAERGFSSNWIKNNSTLDPSRADVLAVKNDHIGGTVYARPTVQNVMANDANGYVIAGQAVLATIGDARNKLEIGGDPANNNTGFRVPNPQAAAYVNNWVGSIAGFNNNIDSVGNIGSPAEYLSSQFIFITAPDYLHNVATPSQMDANPGQLATIRQFTIDNNVLKNAPFATFNATSVGRTPERKTNPSVAYSDGVTTATNYLAKDGTVLPYASTTVALPPRNKIAGDFNGDGARTPADINELVAAAKWRVGANAGWAPLNGIYGVGAGQKICVEIIGDFDGDGSFTSADVRYFADGLAIYSGQLDRRQGFTDVDNAPLSGGNFFGYAAHSTGEAYKPGDARADIAGKVGYSPTPGFAPVAADNAVSAADIDYVYAQFKKNANINFLGGDIADWHDLSKAVFFDLSADMNADLIVDQNDVDEIVTCVLGTSYGDVNLDGVVDAADAAIITAHYGQSGWGWAGGDMNGDGVVDNLDSCQADTNRDGTVDLVDFFKFFGDFDQSNCAANVDGVPGVDLGDFFAFFGAFDQGCNP